MYLIEAGMIDVDDKIKKETTRNSQEYIVLPLGKLVHTQTIASARVANTTDQDHADQINLIGTISKKRLEASLAMSCRTGAANCDRENLAALDKHAAGWLVALGFPT